jgi:hypothetical protein
MGVPVRPGTCAVRHTGGTPLESAPDRSALSSGLVPFDLDHIEDLADGPAVFRLRASGQRVVYVGHADRSGLAAELSRLHRSGVFHAIERFEYDPIDDPEEAAQEARRQIDALRPLYNTGFSRFRNTFSEPPRRGPKLRPASPNP